MCTHKIVYMFDAFRGCFEQCKCLSYGYLFVLLSYFYYILINEYFNMTFSNFCLNYLMNAKSFYWLYFAFSTFFMSNTQERLDKSLLLKSILTLFAFT